MSSQVSILKIAGLATVLFAGPAFAATIILSEDWQSPMNGYDGGDRLDDTTDAFAGWDFTQGSGNIFVLRNHDQNSSNWGPQDGLNPNRQVQFESENLDLTAREFAILEILMRNAGRFVSRQRLEEGIYSWGEEVGSNTVEVYISRLRKRFGSHCIETMRGVGYRMPV